ncbi:Transcriptional regulator, contains XRE-family HTH domain [Lactobacillus bombicola]|uniref:Transcriptional regulator, contains XRE-family HTH domain n=1 Tax=Lactobacillus bombicola TaxID=1505723 RepID=A0A1I1SZD8_9LACO|nr:helix-turn-helix domain-containing protein [Lactobacillus bombicola]SFD51691.1 Transcriptional regulator, contains XRE-family HTH domain [Lactobacillus bombicola]
MNSSFGKYLKQLRLSNRLSMADVFDQTGITNSRLSKLEHDQITDPKISTICKLSKCYQVSVITMLNEAGMGSAKPVPLQHTSFLTSKELEVIQQIIDLFTKERWNIEV